MKTLSVLGLGYVGLPTAAMFATNGLRVLGVDPRPELLRIMDNGEKPVAEPGLNTLVQAAFKSGNLTAHLTPQPADAYIIAVPTPIKPNKAPDLDYVEAATQSIVPHIKKGDLVVLESTVPPRTTERLVGPILERSGMRAGRDFGLAHCPERVLPGSILKELIENDRIIGGIDAESAERAKRLYSMFVKGNIYVTDANTAETTKLAENTFRDVNIAFANELARICESLDINVWEVIRMANRHPRVNILNPGPGVGGHCIPVDPWFLVDAAPQVANLIRTSRQTNDGQVELVTEMVMDFVKDIIKPRVTLIGVAYKANIGDTRESPAIEVLHHLVHNGCDVRVYDPHVSRLEYVYTAERAFEGSDCAVLLVDHKEAGALKPHTLREVMRTPQLIDTRNFFPLDEWAAAGFRTRLLGGGR